MQRVVWGLVLLLIVLHQDVWFWTDERLVFGFLPIGLAWHMGISVGAAVTWWLATKFAWPIDRLERPQAAEGPATEGGAA